MANTIKISDFRVLGSSAIAIHRAYFGVHKHRKYTYIVVVNMSDNLLPIHQFTYSLLLSLFPTETLSIRICITDYHLISF